MWRRLFKDLFDPVIGSFSGGAIFSMSLDGCCPCRRTKRHKGRTATEYKHEQGCPCWERGGLHPAFSADMSSGSNFCLCFWKTLLLSITSSNRRNHTHVGCEPADEGDTQQKVASQLRTTYPTPIKHEEKKH